ncbi:hypothetical protein DPMN_055524 [Dreissena polymorpha]|uniref:Uncharacterized protein n=1 Tax=Dreissena polymorpha TaxID=45954 RepID=A0A9D4HU61_DREPO|nr:hypothetical protein DPMN_055524 [Dreissena polymorpha]
MIVVNQKTLNKVVDQKTLNKVENKKTLNKVVNQKTLKTLLWNLYSTREDIAKLSIRS